MKKEFPIHVFFSYCPESGNLGFSDDAPLNVRRMLKLGYGRGKNGVEYGRVKFNSYSTTYRHTEKQLTHLAWKIKTGEWPSGCVRFIDGNHKNLKWENLRLDRE